MKGIILAGGHGTRLYPVTKVVCKQLLPVYDKPMIYYPLSTIMLAGIREILIISTPDDMPKIMDLLEDGSSLGIKISYKVQEYPRGIADAFIIGTRFIGDDSVCLILGDNIFYGNDSISLLNNLCNNNRGATILCYHVNNPEQFGIVEFDEFYKPVSIEEKLPNPKSNWAIVGLYFYDNKVVSIAEGLKPSQRGELEITDINKIYLKRGELSVERLGRGIAWLDTGTHGSLLEAGQFVETIERRQGFKIACIEEVSYRMGFIDHNQLLKLGENLKASSYGQYILKIAREENFRQP
jgi:glucose-1-phosphate thymidylyltransferase